MNKKSMRKEMNEYFAKLSGDELREKSGETSLLMMKQKPWDEQEIILIFLSFHKEFISDTLINEALKLNKKVAVPRIYGKDMKFHYINSLEDDFDLNKWQIREPLKSSQVWTPVDGKTLMLCPGLAFSKKGERLGRGGGFYDRFLSIYGRSLFTTALCFSEQLKDHIPCEVYDYKVNSICTNKGFYSV